LFLKGFSLAALNPQLLPFWIYVQLQFNSVKPLRIISNLNKISFVIGAGIGSLLLLVCFIFAVTKYKETFLKYLNNKHYYKVLSLLFLILASHQIWLLFLKEDH
jgi:threonine/homoserine/homoserine lactone efflux protein